MTKDFYLRAYSGAIPPCEGERHWPMLEMHLDPPSIKVGPGRPRKNRRKDPHESPKKPGKLSKHGIEMTCSICKLKGHNKRKCPNKDSASAQEPKKKRGRGRPRLDGQEPKPRQASTSVNHITAEPTRVGRGGKTIRGGRGSRGETGRGRGRERVRVPQGVGVMLGADGRTYINEPGQDAPRIIGRNSTSARSHPQASQSSSITPIWRP